MLNVERTRKVLKTRTNSFTGITRMVGFDPAVAYKGADLAGANFSGEDLAGYDFTGAYLDYADCRGADLSACLGLDPAIRDAALHDDATRWPAYWPEEPAPGGAPAAPEPR